MWLGLWPVFNPFTFTSVLLMLRWMQMEAEMVLLIYVVGIVADVRPLHLFLCVYSNVDI